MNELATLIAASVVSVASAGLLIQAVINFVY
jgi:hypothetical protein